MNKPSFFCLLSALLTSVIPHSAASADPAPLFVQASTVRLRAEPSASAKAVGEVAIATACVPLGGATAEGWIQLRCESLTGFTKRELLGDTAPVLDELIAKSNDDAEPASARLNARGRALALALVRDAGGQARRALYAGYADLLLRAELERLRAARQDPKAKLKPKSIASGTCPEGADLVVCGAKTLTRAAEWSRALSDDGDFVLLVLQRDGQLLVHAGAMTQTSVPPPPGGQAAIYKPTLTSELSYLVKPELAVRQALTYANYEAERPLGCSGAFSVVSGGPVCGTRPCMGCSTGCLDACFPCQQKCAGDAACAKACAETAKACAADCPGLGK